MASRDAASDQNLATDVVTELSWDPRVLPNEITVSVKDGVVTLGGWWTPPRSAGPPQRRLTGSAA
jgi:osmotically-inducible protein OsmY